jgi:3-hydroxybutyryl-CoA dehydrogenase
MIKTIAVLGAGTMGHGIAESFALYGYPVVLYARRPEALVHAKELMRQELTLMAEEDFIPADAVEPAVARVATTSDMAEAVRHADYVLESLAEQLELKQTIFKTLDELCQPHAVIATNTSSLALEAISALVSSGRKKRVMVNHWYNPAHLMPLVELSFFGNTSQEVYDDVAALYASIKKQTAKVLKDIPGLLANRIQQGVAREAFWLIANGIGEPADVDKALKFGPAFRYATTGQLEVADFGGLDIWKIVGDNLLKIMDNSQQANDLLRQKVEQGKLGVKTGEGFYTYPADKVAEIRKHFLRKLIHQLKASQYYV